MHLCDDSSSYWVSASPTTSAWLRARHDSLTNEPYQPVFVEVRGRRSNKPAEGFAAEYDGYFEIDTVLSVRAARPDDCRMAELR